MFDILEGRKIVDLFQEEVRRRKYRELDDFILRWARSEDRDRWAWFGKYVQSKREQNNVSREELAKELGITEATLAAIENGLC